jgi:hypothetical protein
MLDAIYLLATGVFVGLAVAYVWICDRLRKGPSDEHR